MGRIHLFEFHDLSWFPHTLRQYILDMLRLGWCLRLPPWLPLQYTPPYLLAAYELKRGLSDARTSTVVDVCSGGGGPVSACQQRLAKQGVQADFILTDLYPNIPAWQRQSEANPHISYVTDPVDATNCQVDGFRTMFASFHHFPPSIATKLVADAVAKNQGIGLFEFTKNSLATMLVYTLLLPLMAFLFTPMLKVPFSAGRYFWTYVIPAIPFVLWFDGMVSCLRTYSQEEMLRIITAADPEKRFRWRIREKRVASLLPIYVSSVVGTPKVANVFYKRSPSSHGLRGPPNFPLIGADLLEARSPDFTRSSSRRLGAVQPQSPNRPYSDLSDLPEHVE